MDLSRAVQPLLHFDDKLGHPLVGGKLYVYEANSSTPATTYNSLGQRNTNPIVLNMRGEADVWLDPTCSYKFVVKNVIGGTEIEADNVSTNTRTFTADGTDGIKVTEEVTDGRTVLHFSIADNSIGKSKLKGARDLIVDEQHLKMNDVDGKIVLSLSDKLAKDLYDSGYDVDDVDIDIQDVTGLQSVLNNKSNVGHTHTKSNITDFAHTHTKNEITDFPSIPTKTSDLEDDSGFITDANADDKQYARKNNSWVEVECGSGASSWDDITGKPETFPPSSHTHSTSDVDGLDSVLRGKADFAHTHTKNEITDFPSIPTKTSDITNDSGFVADAPADGNQYARKDGAWEAVHGAWENLNLSIVDGCESWLSFSSIETKINRSLKCISISGTFILKSSMPSGWNNCITFNPPQGIDSNLQIPFRIFAANNSYGIECFLYGDGRIFFNRRSAPFSGDVYFLTSTPFILFF